MLSASKKRTETLDYMQSMLGQLRTMAESERCDMLVYLIEMAYLEASDIIRGERPSRSANTGKTAQPSPKGQLEQPHDRQQRNRAARMAFEPAGEVEFQQDHEDLRRMKPGVADEFVDADRRRPQRLDHALAVVESPAGGVAEKSGGSSKVTGSGIGRPESGAMASMMSRPRSPGSRLPSAGRWRRRRADRAASRGRRTPAGPFRRRASR